MKFVFLFVFLISCNNDLKYFEQEYFKLNSYLFDSKSSIDSRINEIPELILENLEKIDEKDYKRYHPTPKEKLTLKKYLQELPIEINAILGEKLLGIYFIEELDYSAVTNVVFDDDLNPFPYIVLNPRIFKQSLKHILTFKETSCFTKHTSDCLIRYETDDDLPALYYILTHEIAHVIDYIDGITPNVDHTMWLRNKILKRTIRTTNFIDGIWSNRTNLIKKLPISGTVTFYSKNKLTNINDSKKIYQFLNNSTHISLYATLNWADDFAETFTFYYLTQIRKNDIKLILDCKGQKYSYQFYKNEKVIDRFKYVKTYFGG